LLILLALALVTSGPGAATSEPPSAAALPSVKLPPALDRVLRDYERAWQARDADGLAKLFAEDGFVLAGGRPAVRGRQAIRAAYAGAGGPLALRPLGYAAEGTVGYIVGVYGPAPGRERGKFVLTLRRGPGDRWLITADIDNSSHHASPPPR
jgi:hypothetical protein